MTNFLDALCPLLADAALVWYEFLLRVEIGAVKANPLEGRLQMQSERRHMVVGTAEWMVDRPANIETVFGPPAKYDP